MDFCPQLPALGQALPEFTANTTQGTLTLPADASGKWLVLFSHPADFTPVCTTEFCSFQKRYAGFKELNCMLVGLSIDQVFSHIKWLEWIKEKLNVNIEFPVIADSESPADFRHPLLRHSCQLAQKRPYRRSRHCSPAVRRGRRKTAHEDLRRLRLVVLPQACVEPDPIPTQERSI